MSVDEIDEIGHTDEVIRRSRDDSVSAMRIAGTVLVLLVAAIHLYILWLEMFAWTTPRGRAAFGTTPEFATESKVLAANQGLYNGFLAAGLIWGAIAGSLSAKIFFLACVIVAGVYGAATASRRILYVQAAPALVALIVVLIAR
jgi:putative membrane protein